MCVCVCMLTSTNVYMMKFIFIHISYINVCPYICPRHTYRHLYLHRCPSSRSRATAPARATTPPSSPPSPPATFPPSFFLAGTRAAAGAPPRQASPTGPSRSRTCRRCWAPTGTRYRHTYITYCIYLYVYIAHVASVLGAYGYQVMCVFAQWCSWNVRVMLLECACDAPAKCVRCS